MKPNALAVVTSLLGLVLLESSGLGGELDPPPLQKQEKLVQFANFFTNNLAGKIFVTSNPNRPFQDKIVDYEYDVSYFGLRLDPSGGLTFQSTYNIKRFIYSADANGQKTGTPLVRQNTQTTQCSLRQMTRTTQELVGYCYKIADNSPQSSVLGYARQLRVVDLQTNLLAWTDNSVGYLEGFLIDKAGYAPQYEIQVMSFEVHQGEGASRQTLMRKKVSTYNYDVEKDRIGSLLTETTSESMARSL